MKYNLLWLSCCPACKGDLLLKEQKEERIIQEGVLFCQRCKVDYHIKDGEKMGLHKFLELVPILKTNLSPSVLKKRQKGIFELF